jgi:hypothetical protein
MELDRNSQLRFETAKLFISAISAAPDVFNNHSTQESYADEIVTGAEKLFNYVKNGTP